MPSPAEKAVTEYIADQVRRMRGTAEKKVSYEKIALELGITKPQVFSLAKEGKGAGPGVEKIFADRLFGGSIDQLRAAAVKWWDAQHRRADATEQVAERIARLAKEETRYPSLETAVGRSRNETRWSASAIAAARSMALDADEDPGERWWTETLDRLDTAIKMSVPKLPSRGDDPLAGLDDAPVRAARKKR